MWRWAWLSWRQLQYYKWRPCRHPELQQVDQNRMCRPGSFWTHIHVTKDVTTEHNSKPTELSPVPA